MSILPSSLFGRLVIVLLIGLMLAQVLSMLIFFKDRHQQISHVQETHLAQRIIEIVHVLDSLANSKEQEKFLSVLSTMRLRVFLDTTECRSQTKLSPFVIALKKILQQHLLQHKRLLCIIEYQTATSPVLIPHFIVKIALQKNDWIGFEHIPLIKHEQGLTTSWRLFLTLAVLLLIVLTLSLLAVRWLTQPLAFLAEAAEQLGRDIKHAPLPEKGPREVRRAAYAFNTMQRRLRRYLEDRTRILIAISHDLKTPITRLRLRVEQLDDEKIRASFLKDLDEMQTMTAATLDFMRGLENQEDIQLLDISALLDSLQADYEDMGILVTIQEGAPIPPYPARPLALKRCLVNIIDNAHKYATHIVVTLKTQPKQLHIIITDEGPGIPEEVLGMVFEPFYRVETSRNRATGGTGLGLSIARNIARAHGGDITLRNRHNKGLAVMLSLPLSLE